MVDHLREPRTMILCALPYPPLPIQVDQIEAETCRLSGEEVATTIHTLYAKCIQACVEKNSPEFNLEREKRQREVLQEFLFKLGNGGFELEGEELYHFYCEFAFKHLCTYFNPQDQPQIRFKPYCYMAVGDHTHKKMVEYCNAQGILFEEKPLQDVSKMPLGEILLKIRERIGRSEEIPDKT